MIRAVFAGTPEFAVPSLEALAAHPRIELVAVYTGPDRPAGRGQKTRPSAVKTRALELGLAVYQPESVQGAQELARLRALAPQLMVVTAYGALLPRPILDLPRCGCFNIHASLLPRWRGAAPIQRAIQAGDTVTGVSLMGMETRLDSGPVLAVAQTPLPDSDTAGTLHDRLSVLGGRLLADNLDALLDGRLVARPQDEAGATYARKLTVAESGLNFYQDAVVLWRTVRAFVPWPLATAKYYDQVLRIHQCSVVADVTGAPGQILAADASGIVVAAGNGAINIEVLQRPGRRPLAAREFLNGYPLVVGSVLT